ncbi:hypothetical protein PHYPSEUDO_011748 [Phytophthora pseudosyringae]|uniref:Uncharacterized protein n=1 Tax=Phytophthora pseudosyringae TaxID=221518 RepID=A0A8T1VBB3_9STRA|nr:hypothetical protein PHYPSEUDO_011748 [Phytophthora pseudosyringae]
MMQTFVTPREKFIRSAEVPLPPPSSVLHPITRTQRPLNPMLPVSSKTAADEAVEFSESFPQHGVTEPGKHYRIQNTNMLAQGKNRANDSLLFITVFNDAQSWGHERSVDDFFTLVGSLNIPQEKTSVALLTSSHAEFLKLKELFRTQIQQYSSLSVIFRNDFSPDGLTRDNRHDDHLQGDRRRMIARYRNYALLSTLQTWHQHVIWLDADVSEIPADLIPKMTQSGLDIIHPLCAQKYGDGDGDSWFLYDRNAWVGHRKVRPPLSTDFVPGPLSSKNMEDLNRENKTVVQLDSVGGAMLYVRADVHRQGVIFPVHYIIGSEWGAEGYDGIETEGMCYTAHFLGFKCWGMPKEIIYHSE